MGQQLARASGTSRERTVEPAVYEDLCNQAVDFWYGGEAQMAHVKRHLLRRLGQAEPARKIRPDELLANSVAGDRVETDAGRIIRQELTELVTMPTVRSVINDLAVLYSADDQRRVYLRGSDEAAGVDEVIEDYHREGGLDARLLQLDSLVVLLRTACLAVRWCAPRKCVSYDVMLPHWVRLLPHPLWPLDPKLAYAIAYNEATDDGRTVWCAYVRPPIDDDPIDAPTRDHPEGRLVRWADQSAPFPLPKHDDKRIIEDVANPLAAIGGMKDNRLLWSPIVWHWAEPPIETVWLPPPTDLVRVALEIDVAFSLIMRLANMQTSGQPVLKGMGQLPAALGPSSVVRIDDPQGDFYFATPSADLSACLGVIRSLFTTYAQLSKLAPDSYSMTRPSISTGPAKRLEQTALAERRWARTTTADQWERDRFDLERLYHNEFGGGSIGWDVRQEMHWGELRVPVDRGGQVQRLAGELALGASSRLDAIMEIWGLDRSTAEAKMTEIDGVAPGPDSATGDLSTTAPAPEPESTEAGDSSADDSAADAPARESQSAEESAEAVDPTTALNGAQVIALLDTVQRVVDGVLPRESAIRIITAAFPITAQDADKILGKIGHGFKPKPATADPAPVPGAAETKPR